MAEINKNDIVDSGLSVEIEKIATNFQGLADAMDEVLSSGKKLNDELKKGQKTRSQVEAANKKLITNTDILAKKEIEINNIRKKTTELLAKTGAERTKEGKQLIKLNELRKKQAAALKEEITGEKAAAQAIKESVEARKAVRRAAIEEAKAKKLAIAEAKRAAIATKKEEEATKKAGIATLKRVGQESQYFKALKQTNAANEKAARANEKLKLTLNAAEGSYNKLNHQLTQNITKYKALSPAQRNSAKEGGKVLLQIRKQDKELKRLDKTLGKHNRNVGNYKSALSGLAGAFGFIGGIALFGAALRKSIGIGVGFEKQMSKVQAVTGATNEEFLLLEESAKNLGETTEKTASEVAGLQLELAKLGLSPDEIVRSTEAILNLSTAAGADLAQSAKVAAATMKGFGLEAEDVTEIADVMAKSFSSSALDIGKFETAMATVAPVAKNAGVSLEATTAQLSLLVDRGLDASTAGTSLRNIFLTLSQEGLTLEQALERVRTSVDQNKEALDLFGKRGATAAIIMANNQEEAVKLTAAYEDSAGAAQQMADIMRDNVSGDADKARSALEGLAISFTEGTNPAIRGAIQGFTAFIQTLAGTRDKSQELKDEFDKQNRSLQEIEKTIPGLLEEYDKLIAKEELSAEEQERLNEVIDEVSKILPGAVSGFDAYGNAISLSTDEAEEAIKIQKELINVLKEQTVGEVITSIIEKQAELNRTTGLTSRGFLAQATFLDGIFRDSLKASTAELAAQQLQMKSLSGEIDDGIQIFKDLGLTNEQIVKQISGDNLNSQLARQITERLEAFDKLNQATTDNLNLTKASDDVLATLSREATGRVKELADRELAIRENKATKEALIEKQANEKIAKERERAENKRLAAEKKKVEDAKKIADEKFDREVQLITDTLAAQSIADKKELIALKARFANKEISEKEFQEEVIKLSEKSLRKQISNLQTLLDNTSTSIEVRQQLAEDIADLEIALDDEVLDNSIANNKKDVADFRAAEAEKLAIRRAAIRTAAEIGNILFEIQSAKRDESVQEVNAQQDEELLALTNKYNSDIAAAGDNAEEKKQIDNDFEANKERLDKQYDEERRKLQIKQAKADRLQALFNITINTAAAIAEASPIVPLMIAAGIVGAAQTALVLATPIPEFDKGTDYTPSTYWAGEKRPEIREHNGQLSLVKEPTLFTNSPGDKIISGADTSQMFDNGIMDSLRLNGVVKPTQQDDRQLNAIKDLKGAVLSQKPVGINIGKKGIEVIYNQHKSKNLRIDKYNG